MLIKLSLFFHYSIQQKFRFNAINKYPEGSILVIIMKSHLEFSISETNEITPDKNNDLMTN